MSARMFIGLMIILMVFTAGLFVYAAPGRGEKPANECPSAKSGSDNAATTAADIMMWESVSKHLLNVIQ